MHGQNFAAVSNRDPWGETYEIKAKDTGQHIVLLDPGTGLLLYTVTVEIKRGRRGPGYAPISAVVPYQGPGPLVSGSTADGSVTVPSDGFFSWAFTDAQMAALAAPATYEVVARIVSIAAPSTDALTVFLGTLPVIEG